MAQSIAKLRIYQNASELEARIFELVQQVPPEHYYPTADDARRASAAVCHHLYQTHQHYSYILKLEELAAARRSAEALQRLLPQLQAYGDTQRLAEGYVGIIKQSWGLTKYLKQRQNERQAQARAQAADELVAARA